MSNDLCPERTPSHWPSQEFGEKFEVYDNEPVLRFLVRRCCCGTTTLILGFYAVVTAPLFLFHKLSDPPEEYLSFVESVSWSYSMVFLFPFIVGLTLIFYRRIPELYIFLIETLVENRNESNVRQFIDRQRHRFTARWTPAFLFAVTLVLNGFYFMEVLDDAQTDWMNSGILLQGLLSSEHGMTWHGLYAALVQIVLIYWVLNLIWNGFVFAFSLREFFNEKSGFRINVDPLHPDGVCGLRPIGEVTFTLNFILFLIGIYLSLKVIDKMVMQASSLFEDIGNPTMLGGYAILAPLLFFLPLAAAHNKMQEARDDFLRPLSKRSHDLVTQISTLKPDDNAAEYIKSLSQLEQLRDNLKRKILVWPFDFKSLQAFFGTIVVPLLPILFPLLIGRLLE